MYAYMIFRQFVIGMFAEPPRNNDVSSVGHMVVEDVAPVLPSRQSISFCQS